MVVVEDSCEVCHARFAFPDGVAVDAGGSVLVEGEAAFADVFSGFVSPDVRLVALWAWCAEFDGWFEECLDLAYPSTEVLVQCCLVLLVVGV